MPTSPPSSSSARRPSRVTSATSWPSSKRTRARTRWRLRFAKPLSIRAGLLVGAAALAILAAILYASSGVTLLGAMRLLAAIAAAALVALYLILAQRERHQRIE